MNDLTDEDVAAIKHYCINPVEAREASLDPVDTLEMAWEQPADVAVIEAILRERGVTAGTEAT